MTETWRSDYQRFVDTCPGLPIFFEPWLLDILAPGWQAVVLVNEGHPLGVWTWYPRIRWGLHTAAMPLLMRFMGPYLMPGQPADILGRLWSMLPRMVMMEQHLHYTISAADAVAQLGCHTSERISYHMDLRRGHEALWQDVRPAYRNQKIPRAAASLVVAPDDDVDAFLRVNRATYTRQGLEAPAPADLVRRLSAAAHERGRGRILLARDHQNNEVMSGAFLLWDQDTIYHLMAGDDPRGRPLHAGIFLTWACIAYGIERGLHTFDFLGSMIPSIAAVRRQFGAVPTPYPGIRYFRWPMLEHLVPLLEKIKS
jgi:hypothetical protein